MSFFSHTWFACLLAFLPGPPRLKFYNAQFSLFPVDKTNRFCPEILLERDVGFYFYSREYQTKPRKLRIGDDAALATCNLNLKLPTVIYFPPFFDGIDSENVKKIRTAYLLQGGHNFIVVGYERLNAGPWYSTAVSNTFVIGKYSALFIDYLISKGISSKSLHLVGFSIGAHIAGVAAKHLKSGKIHRITGLDPASLLFTQKHPNMRLTKADADLVDVIHTDRIFGMFYPIGHVDFFIDPEVYPAPGCKFTDVFGRSKGVLYAVFCSHLRSNDLFAISIINPTAFPGRKCFSWKNFQLGVCRSDLVEFMGLLTSPTARGIYYVHTSSFFRN